MREECTFLASCNRRVELFIKAGFTVCLFVPVFRGSNQARQREQSKIHLIHQDKIDLSSDQRIRKKVLCHKGIIYRSLRRISYSLLDVKMLCREICYILVVTAEQ